MNTCSFMNKGDNFVLDFFIGESIMVNVLSINEHYVHYKPPSNALQVERLKGNL